MLRNKMVRKSLRLFMHIPNCRETSELLSRAQEQHLSLRERVGLHVHLVACEGCRNFRRQLDFMRAAVKRYLGRDGM